MGDRRGVYRFLVGKPEGRRPLGRRKRRWEDHIKLDPQEVGCGDMDWIYVVQDGYKVAGTCDCGNEPSGSVKCGELAENRLASQERLCLVPKFAGSHPAEVVGFLRENKNPQHAFLRRGSTAVCPML